MNGITMTIMQVNPKNWMIFMEQNFTACIN